jgi:conjugative transposon TraM protein
MNFIEDLTESLREIDLRQNKYKTAIFSYVAALIVGNLMIYAFSDADKLKPKEPDNHLETMESLNPNLPQAQNRNNEIGGRYENMTKSFGKIQDYSAVENIEREDAQDNLESYDSKYTDEDLAFIDQKAADRSEELEELVRMQDKLRKSAERGREVGDAGNDGLTKPMTEEERKAASEKHQQEALASLKEKLDAIRSNNKGEESRVKSKVDAANTIEINSDIVSEPDEKPGTVVKRIKKSSDYFNTLSDNEAEPRLIKAIIDENISAVDGSRVRLRLLDDVEINDVVVPQGSYIYATMSGFGSQRVKGNVNSLMIGDELIKVSLTIYDTDGLEGLYVPSSSFRETSKDVTSSALGSNMTLNSGSYRNNLSQWGMQAMQNAYQRTTNAISKAVKKNKARLKYGTFVYLVNTKEKKD